MGMTRRRFVYISISAAALPLAGCGGEGDAPKPETRSAASDTSEVKKSKPKLPTEPFLIGQPSEYREPGVYETFYAAASVWLVSDGKQLVALNGLCTHLGCLTEWDADAECFTCPCHQSEFDIRGINGEDAKAKRPLERCALSLVQTAKGDQLQVNPTQRFREEKGQWSEPLSAYHLG